MAYYYILNGDTITNEAFSRNSMFISKGGSAIDTTLYEKARMFVSKGGAADNTEVSSGRIYVLNGGVAYETTVNDGGSMFVSKGGLAEGIRLSWGTATISKGGSANDVIINKYGVVTLGGTLNNAVINSDGGLEVVGGTLKRATIDSCGTIKLYGGNVSNARIGYESLMEINGGTVSNLTISSYASASLYGGTVNNAKLDSNCSMYVAQGTVNGATIGFEAYIDVVSGSVKNFTISAGSVYISSGAKLNSAVVSSGYLDVEGGVVSNIDLTSASADIYSSGAKGTNIKVNSGASMYVYYTAAASNVKIFSGGRLYLEDEGKVNGLFIDSGAVVNIGHDCSATKINWTPGNGYISCGEGAQISFSSKYSSVYLGTAGAYVSRTKKLTDDISGDSSAYVAKGGSASGVKVLNGAEMIVMNGGKATNISCSEYGASLIVASGGTAEDVTLSDSASLVLYGGKAEDVTIDKGGAVSVFNGSASEIALKKGGYLRISSATVTDVTWTPFSGSLELEDGAHITFANALAGVYVGDSYSLYSHDDNKKNWTVDYTHNKMYVMSGATAEGTTISYGEICVFGGSVVNTFFTDEGFMGGTMYLYDKARAVDTTISSGGLFVSSGARAERTSVYYYGHMEVCDGGSAADVTLYEGYMEIWKGGSAIDVTISSGASIYIENGGKLNSAVVSGGLYRDGGMVYVSSGAVVSNLQLGDGTTLYVEKGGKVVNVQSSYGSFISTEKGATVKNIKAGEKNYSKDCDYDGQNGWDTKNKKINFYVTDLAKPLEFTNSVYDYDIKFDTGEMSIGTTYNNYVGYGDEIDFKKIELKSAAALYFSITATEAAKFTIWQWDTKKKKLVSLQSTTLKSNGSLYSSEYTAFTKNILLTAGEYYLSVESTEASKGGNAYYNVTLSESEFFTNCDTKDDDGNQFVKNEALAETYSFGTLYETTTYIEDGWVGYGDSIDFRRFTLQHGAKLSFMIETNHGLFSDSAKFTIWKYDEKKKKLVSVQTTKVQDYSATTAELLLGHGTYYYSVESTNAKNGGWTSYSIYLNSAENEFFDAGYNGDDWTDLATNGADSTEYYKGTMISGTGDLFGGYDWVGFDDEYDYLTFTVKDDAKLTFSITADDDVKLTVFTLTKKNGKWKQNTLLSKTLKLKKLGVEETAVTGEYQFTGQEKNTYFISVQSLNAKKAESGAWYVVGVDSYAAVPGASLAEPLALSGSQDACSLDMPEAGAADVALNTQDDLSFGQVGADALAAFDGLSSQQMLGEEEKGLLASL
jgi:autotransporter passenger strand-loop-strand repeat protein